LKKKLCKILFITGMFDRLILLYGEYKLFVNSVIILLSILIISKEVIIMNEELLLIIAFSIFFIVSYRFIGELLSAELDIRAAKMVEEFEELKLVLMESNRFNNSVKMIQKEIEASLVVDETFVSFGFVYGDNLYKQFMYQNVIENQLDICTLNPAIEQAYFDIINYNIGKSLVDYHKTLYYLVTHLLILSLEAEILIDEEIINNR